MKSKKFGTTAVATLMLVALWFSVAPSASGPLSMQEPPETSVSAVQVRESLQEFGRRLGAIRVECAPAFTTPFGRYASRIQHTLGADVSDDIAWEGANSRLEDLLLWLSEYESEVESRCLSYDTMAETLLSMKVHAEGLWPRIKEALVRIRGEVLVDADGVPTPRGRRATGSSLFGWLARDIRYGFEVSQGSIEEFLGEYVEVQDGRVSSKAIDGVVERSTWTRQVGRGIFEWTVRDVPMETFEETIGGGRYVFRYDQPRSYRDVVPSTMLMGRAMPYLQAAVTATCVRLVQSDAAFVESLGDNARHVDVGDVEVGRLFEEAVVEIGPEMACAPGSADLVDRFRENLREDVLKRQEAVRDAYKDMYGERFARTDWVENRVLDYLRSRRLLAPGARLSDADVFELQSKYDNEWLIREREGIDTERLRMEIAAQLAATLTQTRGALEVAMIEAESRERAAAILGDAEVRAAEIDALPNVNVNVSLPLGGSHAPNFQ